VKGLCRKQLPVEGFVLLVFHGNYGSVNPPSSFVTVRPAHCNLVLELLPTCRKRAIYNSSQEMCEQRLQIMKENFERQLKLGEYVCACLFSFHQNIRV
jgi:hypothetical protein